jgi:hypothetical protein
MKPALCLGRAKFPLVVAIFIISITSLLIIGVTATKPLTVWLRLSKRLATKHSAKKQDIQRLFSCRQKAHKEAMPSQEAQGVDAFTQGLIAARPSLKGTQTSLPSTTSLLPSTI